MGLLVIRIAVLVFSLLVMQIYVYTGARSKTHRLLPVLLTCVCLYGFYEVVLSLTQEDRLFWLLEKLLMMQVIFIVLHYAFDFTHQKIKKLTEVLFYFLLILGDVIIFMTYYKETLVGTVLYFLLAYSIPPATLLYIIYKSRNKVLVGKRERFVTGLLTLAIVIPFSIMPFKRKFEWGPIAMMIAFSITNCIVLFLVLKNYLFDLSEEMQGKLYENSDIATILYDSKAKFLDANQKAKDSFGYSFCNQLSIEQIKNQPIVEYYYCVYKFSVEEISLGNGFMGYAVHAMDITEEWERMSGKNVIKDVSLALFAERNIDEEVLEVFRQELRDILADLDMLRKTDIETYRVKVHGIKSTAKQLGFTKLGEVAEIMEMAAKTDNLRFIDAHRDELVESCNRIIFFGRERG